MWRQLTLEVADKVCVVCLIHSWEGGRKCLSIEGFFPASARAGANNPERDNQKNE